MCHFSFGNDQLPICYAMSPHLSLQYLHSKLLCTVGKSLLTHKMLVLFFLMQR